MKLIQDLRVPYHKDPNLNQIVAAHLGITPQNISEIRILKRSLDARNRHRFFWIYTLEVYLRGEIVKDHFEPFPQVRFSGPPPLIVGAGPAGLFAAWTFLQHGIRPLLLERGDRTHERMRKISRFWRYGTLDTDSNVCNGEGGAGTFSDGKLITRIKNPLMGRMMQAFVDYGAPREITYVYNPHVGSNLIRNVIQKMSDDLMSRGADLRFCTRVDGLDLSGSQVQGVFLADGTKIPGTGLILACGHSAGDFFKILHKQGIHFEPKSFALGLRIEHPQTHINQWQYGCAVPPDGLDVAQYKLQTYWDEEKIGVYTFCMCPGGYVIASSTDPDSTVINGMSNYHRNSPWANAAVVCSVDHEKTPGSDPFKMMAFQREIEKKVYAASGEKGLSQRIPAQHLNDFLAGKSGPIKTRSSCPSGVVAVNLKPLLPDWIYEHLRSGLLAFEQKRRGFAHPDAIVHAVESRTSSPVRITRNPETLESISTQGLFPCGEGPGYAGGITSAAVDGMKAALAWIEKFGNS